MHYGADAAESSMSLASKCQCKQSRIADRIKVFSAALLGNDHALTSTATSS